MLDAVRSGVGGSLVVTGEAGIGKSTLLRAAERLAPEFRCVRVRGVESEQPMAYAGLHQALAPLRERLSEIPQVQAQALGWALGWASGPSEPERFLVAAATMSVIAAEAEGRPVLVVVDDVLWLDHESAGALAFAARRLEEDPVCFLWSARDRSATGDLLRGVPEMPLSGLSQDAARALVGRLVVPRVVDRLAVETGGNPLGLLEISSRLNESQRLGAEPLPDRLPLGERLEADYQRLLSGLSEPARQAVLLCAIDRTTSLSTVAGALAAEGHDSDAALDEALRLGVLMQRDSGLGFRHPLLRSAAVSGASPAERRHSHHLLAETLSGRSLPLAAAWHYAEASINANPVLAEELVRVAHDNRSKAGYAAASAVLVRAALLAGDATRAAELLAGAAEDALLAGDVPRTRSLVRRVLDDTTHAPSRGRALVVLGLLELTTGSVPRAAEMLSSAVAVAEGSALTQALSELAMARFRLGDMAGIADCAARMVDVSDRTDPFQRLLIDFTHALAAAVHGDAASSHELMTAVIADAGKSPLRDDPRAMIPLAMAAGFLGDVTPVFSLGEHLLSLARERGAFGVLVPALALSAAGRSWLGDTAGAFADAAEAAELGDQLGYAVDVANAVDMVAWQSAARGRHADARQALARARELTDRAQTTSHAAHLALTEAFCALCRGDPEHAIAALEPRLVADGGIGSSGEPLGVAPDLVEAYAAVGRRSEAADLAARYAAVTPRGAPPLTMAVLARTQALVMQHDDEALNAFDEALTAHAATTNPFETARTRLMHGSRLRRAGRRTAARDHLRRAGVTSPVASLSPHARFGSRYSPRGALRTRRSQLPSFSAPRLSSDT
jgi:tetratricopeptide (TPR) repeat protein